MFAKIKKWKQGKIKTAYLLALAVFFLGAYIWRPSFGQNNTTAGQKAANAMDKMKMPANPTDKMGQNTPGIAKQEEFRFFAPFRDERYHGFERWGLIIVLIVAVAGLGYAAMLVGQVNRADQGTVRMQEIARAVREGANAYLAAQFRRIGPLILIITVILYFTYTGSHRAFAVGRAAAFFMGSIFSWLVGFVGMRLATKGNLRVAAAATRSYGEAMQLGYRTGTITGMLTDGLGLLGGTFIFLIFGEQAYEALLGFGFGGTLLALFMRVGGGIYTKAADVGADLVGKIEKDIPEDDPRNAATIADNVGDNVGDCAGMAADIFESYEVTIVAAMIPGWANFGQAGLDMRPAWTCFIGIILCVCLNRITEYFTGTEYEPVRGIKRNTETGHGATIIEGFAVGYESAVWTAVILCAAIYASVLIYTSTMQEVNPIFIAYGVAMCGIGMLTLTGNTVSMDVFGPIADNANGIAQMGFEVDGKLIKDERHLKESRQILADLDAVGNTTKAVTKGVAIGSAVIAAVSLYPSFITVIRSGGGGQEKQLPIQIFNRVAGLLSVSSPKLFLG